jgi:hypothetical protein
MAPKRKKAAVLHIAVVWSGRPSDRPSGGFEAYVGTDKGQVTREAMAAKARWDGPYDRSSCAPTPRIYRVLVGTLLEEASIPVVLGPVGEFSLDV